MEIASSISRLAPNSLNQYATVAGVSYGYDGKGNLTSDGLWTFAYDAENRLLTASKTGVAAAYAYDPLGRRTRKSGVGNTVTGALFTVRLTW